MKTAEQIIADHIQLWCETDCVEKEWAIACVKEFAREAIDEVVGNLELYATIDVSDTGEVTQVILNRKAINKLLNRL